MSRKRNKKRVDREVAYWAEPAFLAFTEDLLKLMGDQVSQAELARRVGVSRGYISRVFGGMENLTLETMTKLALALGASVRLHVAPLDRVTRWFDVTCVNDAVAELPMNDLPVAGEALSPAPSYSAGNVGSAPINVVK